MKLTFLIILIAVFFIVSSVFGGDMGKSPIESQINSFVEGVMTNYNIPGLAIGVVKDGQILYTKGYGYKNIETKEPITDICLFHMASISKPFVATAVMQLVQAGKIDLDAPVIQYLPYFKLNDPRYKHITVRQMLTHTSGMPDVEDYEWEKPQYDDNALTRYVLSLDRKQLISDPGEKFRYSNMAYEVLGNMIAKVSRMSFEDYMKQNILEPLDMQRSTFFKGKASKILCTYPHVWKLKTEVSEVYPYNRAHAPSSTLHSNAVEMCQWAIANLNRGEYNNNRILDATGFNQLWKPYSDACKENKVGLSWFLRENNGVFIVHHGGGDVGYSTQLSLKPREMTAVVVLSNYDKTPAAQISDGIWAIIF